MTREEAISAIERLAHVESKWPGTEDTLDALDMAVSALRPVSREQVEKVWRGYWGRNEIYSEKSTTGEFLLPTCRCSKCGVYVHQEANFCPACGAPMTDEAVQMVMERLEALHDTGN